MPRTIAALVAGWVWCAALAATSAQTPVFRSAVDLVRVDVSVLDANGRPVHGLSASDFMLLEDGKPQTIEAVSEVNVPDAEDGAPWVRNTAPDVRSNSAEDGRVVILLLDDAMTPGADAKAMAATVRNTVGAVIDRLGPTDLVAVLFTWQNKVGACMASVRRG